jgi:hypothetical protein
MSNQRTSLSPHFALDLDGAAAPSEIRVEAAFARTADDQRQACVAQVFADLAGLGACGALSGKHLDPVLSSLVRRAPTLSDRGITQVFEKVRVDPGLFRCLLNVLEWAHDSVAPFSTVRVSWADLARLPSPGSLPFPARWPLLTYELRMDELDRRFDIEIEFREPQPDEMVLRVNQQLGLWATAVNRGAYAGEGMRPSDSCIFLTDDVMDTSEKSIVWYIDALRAHDAAIEGALNALERIHRTVAPLRMVTVSS